MINIKSPKNFTQIPEAVDAEDFVLKKAEEWATDVSITADEAILLEKLKELINEDSISLPALEAKVDKLQLQLQDAETVQQSLQDTNDNLVEAIDQLSSEFNAKVAETETKDAAISILNETIDKTLTDLGTSVTAQIENAADAFDALSDKLEKQAKRAEEAGEKQLAAFEKAVGGIASALKPAEPEPDPENPAVKIIKQIFTEWDKIYVITNGKYNNISNILRNIGVKSQPARLDYVLTPPMGTNSFGSGQEINQILKWNDTFKPQFKELISSITDKNKATSVLEDTKVLSANTGGINELRDTISNIFDEHSRDTGGSRGVGQSTINKAIIELDPTFNVRAVMEQYRNMFALADITKIYGQNLIQNVSDPEVLIRILRILSEINDKVEW